MIVVTGAESTGTRMVTKMLTEAGGTVRHWPIPQGNIAKWFELPSADAYVVMVRDLRSTVLAQVVAGHVLNTEQAKSNIRAAYRQIFRDLLERDNWWIVSYESLARSESVINLCALLGLYGLPTTKWNDANAKYYGGKPWQDHTNINGLEVTEHHRNAHREARKEQ